MDQKLKDHVNTLNDLDKLILLKDTVNSAIRCFKAKEKSQKAEYEYGFNRVGVRGGKFTTLAANSQRNAESYFKSLEMVKIISKLI